MAGWEGSVVGVVVVSFPKGLDIGGGVPAGKFDGVGSTTGIAGVSTGAGGGTTGCSTIGVGTGGEAGAIGAACGETGLFGSTGAGLGDCVVVAEGFLAKIFFTS